MHHDLLKRRFHNMMIEKYNRLAIVNKKYGKLTVGLGQWTSLRRSAATDYCARFAEKKPQLLLTVLNFIACVTPLTNYILPVPSVHSSHYGRYTTTS